MKEGHKILIEHVIYEFKKTDGKVYTDYYNTLFENNDTQFIITKILTEELYIEKIDSQYYILKTKGWDFTSFKEIEEKELAKTKSVAEKEKLEIDLAKSNIEANILNKEVAEQNTKIQKRNNITTWVNIIIGILNFLALMWQIIKAAK
jgi:hypothetical protein